MDDFDVIDPLAELERYITDCTCEWCDRIYGKIIQRQWATRVCNHNGYTSKHRRLWRVCDYCLSGMRFDKWVFPAIQNMPEFDMEAIISVQPMMRVLPDGVDMRVQMLKHRTDNNGGVLNLNFHMEYRLNDNRTVERTTRTPLGQTTHVIHLDDP